MTPAPADPRPPQPDNPKPPTAAEIAGQYARQAGVERGADGQIDVLKSVGGWRGLAEAIVPGLLFTVVFTINADLVSSLIVAVAAAVVFTVPRLVQRTPLTQALSGVIGVAFCAFVALRTGDATDYFVPGFFTNAAYIAAMLISLAVKWPVAGLLFGFIRGEGVTWRRNRGRLRLYNYATLLIMAVLGLRLVVQVPLYLAGNFVALGTTRLIMGLPLYAAGLWLAWVISRPAPAPEA